MDKGDERTVMLRRKIEKKLLDWKAQEEKPCLLVHGARQVGKTYIIEKFARENYENYIYINFELMQSMKAIFEGDLDFRTLKLNLEVNFPEVKIERGKTLLFLDEIGACPQARTALKTFAMDGTIDVVASGSLLGLHYREVASYPVGYEKPLTLYPLDFEEFLWALGVSEETTVEVRRSFIERRPLTEALLSKINKYYRLYMIVGGMPAAVNAYLEEESLAAAREVQVALVENYKNDVAKYAPTVDKQKILKTFASIPMQLAKKNKKFVWNDIDVADQNASERKYGSALGWLLDAGVVNPCYNLSEPALPLNTNRRLNSYKVYLHDTGMLVGMLERDVPRAILGDDLQINAGSIAENAVAGELVAHGHGLTYFERKDLEVDFVLNLAGRATAIEVKSGRNAQAKSLDSIRKNYPTVTRYVKLERNANVGVDEVGVEHYPLFMGMFL